MEEFLAEVLLSRVEYVEQVDSGGVEEVLVDFRGMERNPISKSSSETLRIP